ncbi:MAG: hypothetical protein K8F36_01465 [Melioribacteraceae bacterium]|nr:hypothetical protein [Melioribacteraceae bacterium]
MIKILLIILVLITACGDESNYENSGHETDSAVIMLNQKKAEAELLEREIEELRKKNDSLSREFRKYEIFDTLAVLQTSSRIDKIILVSNSFRRSTQFWTEKLGFNINDPKRIDYFLSFKNEMTIELFSQESFFNRFPSIKNRYEKNYSKIYVSIKNKNIELLSNYFDKLKVKSILDKEDNYEQLFFEDEYLTEVIFTDYRKKNSKKSLDHKNGASEIVSIIFGANEPEAALDKLISIGIKPEKRIKLSHLRKDAYKFNLKNCFLYLVKDELNEGIIGLEILSSDLSLTEAYFADNGVEFLKIDSDKSPCIKVENDLIKLFFVEGKH